MQRSGPHNVRDSYISNFFHFPEVLLKRYKNEEYKQLS